MTTRRKLLQSLPAMVAAPVLLRGRDVGRSVEVSGRYLVFLNADLVDVAEFARTCEAFPSGTPLYPVYLPQSRDMDEVIRIFKLDKE